MHLKVKSFDGIEREGAEVSSYVSAGGTTLRAELNSEDYVILSKGDKTVDVDFSNGIIRIYDDAVWKVHPMNKESQTTEVVVGTSR